MITFSKAFKTIQHIYYLNASVISALIVTIGNIKIEANLKIYDMSN